jgi:two-component system chemotaxis response regulator CheB
VVDDSDIASRRLEQILEAAPDIRVVRRLESAEALWSSGLLSASPVVVLDLWMPGTSGLGALRGLVGRVPVVIVSDADHDSDLARESLAQGARAFVSKKELGRREGQERLRRIVREAALGELEAAPPVLAVIGSTGAPRALERLVPEWSDLSAAAIFVQHLAHGSEDAFARWLTGLGLRTRPAKSGDRLSRGEGLLAPGGRHLLLSPPATVRLGAGKPGEVHVPSGDRLLESALFLGRRLVVVVLSGMGDDAARGVAAAVRQGALCVVQEPTECVVDSMPRAAMAASRAVRAVPLAQLGTYARELVRRG